MSQLLGFGTGTVNFFGRYAYVGEGEGGLSAVVWTEQTEPQAAIGSYLHKLAYPDNFKKHVEENKSELHEAYDHHAREILGMTAHAVQLEVEDLAHPQSLHLAEAQALERPLYGGTLDVENARLEAHEDTGFHEPEPTMRR